VQQLAKITAFFTVPTMGVPPNMALRAIPRVEEMMEYMIQYDSPRFPGRVNKFLAVRGQEIYRYHCATCHGDYDDSLDQPRLSRFPNRLSPQSEMGTDAARWRAIDEPLIQAIRATGFAEYVAPRNTGGYVAPRLTALWATAPYLHNGSVPTLNHLLNPNQRPKKFYVGGHKLDFDQFGIAGALDGNGTWNYPNQYVPWSIPTLYNTEKPGHANDGHEKEFAPVADAESQRALLEYLKLL
jgi:mono/diheme cytochrome c family protein